MAKQILSLNSSWSVVANNGTLVRSFAYNPDGTISLQGGTGAVASAFKAIVSAANITTSDKTFSFVNRSGTLALEDNTSLLAMLPTTTGNSGYVLSNNGGTTLSWIPAGTASLSSLNGISTATYNAQTFAATVVSGTNTGPTWVSVNNNVNTHTFNIPLASNAATSVGGLLTNAEYANLVKKDPGLDGQTLAYPPLVTNTSTNVQALATVGQVNAAKVGISVRPPVAIIDTVNYTTALPTALTNAAQSYTYAIGDRVLYTNLTGAMASYNNKVFVVAGITGNVTWVGGGSTPTTPLEGQSGTGVAVDGDLIFIRSGSNADQQWAYNGTQWVQYSVAASYTFNNGVKLTTTTVSIDNTWFSGDFTVGATGIATILNNAVTYGKFQTVAASSLVGNPTAGSANATNITLGAALTFSGSALQTVAFTGGDVTSPANSVVLTIAANAVTNAKLATAPANTFKGNNTAGVTNPTDMTVAQAKTLLAYTWSDLGYTPATKNRLTVVDTAYTIATTQDAYVAVTSITAARTITLPAATTAGQILWIFDESGSVTSTNTITITRAGTDTIEGQTTNVISSAYGATCLESNGAGKWTILVYEEIPVAVADANYTVTLRNDIIVYITSLTATRTITLPPATTTGQRVTIVDMSGSITPTVFITIARNGTDTVNSALTSINITAPYGSCTLIANGVSKWNANLNTPMAAIGDITYGGTGGVPTRLAGNTTNAKQFLTSTGTGTVANAPAYSTVLYTDLQSVPTVSIVGNSTGGTAVAQALTLGATFTFSGTVIQTVAMTGDVTTAANSFATTISKVNNILINDLGLQNNTATIADNQAAALVTGCSWAVATYRSVRIEYQLSRGAGNYTVGYLTVLQTSASTTQLMVIEDDSIGTHGVTFTSDVSAGSMRLLAASTATGTAVTMYFRVKAFLL
jgi:hypothetical protein